MVDGSIRIDTKVDSSGATTGINKLGSSIKSLGKIALASIGVAAVGAITQFGKQAISLASDLQEVQNVVDVAFGDMAYKAEQFAKTALETFGLSELSAKKYSSTFMAMSTSMGLGAESASNMALAITGLVGDVASFYNISQELAATKLKSIWTGETETLKDLGVVMTQANLEAYALSKGITKSISSMTQAEQVTLRYQYVTDQLALAQGDFARTSDSWANKTRVLSEQFNSFLAVVGKLLINGLTPLLGFLSDGVALLTEFAEAVNALVLVNEGTNNISDSATSAADAENELADSIDNVNESIKEGLAGFDELNVLQDGLSEDVDFGDVNFGDVGTTEIGEGVEVSSDIKDALQELRDMFAPTYEKFKTFISGIGNVVKSIYDEFIKPTVDSVKNNVLPAINNLFSSILNLYNEALSPIVKWFADKFTPVFAILVDTMIEWKSNLINVFSDVVDFVTNVFTGKWEDAWQSIKDIFSGIWDSIKSRFSGYWEAITTLFYSFFPDFDKDWKQFWSGVKDTFEDIWNNIQSFFQGIWDGIINSFKSGLNGMLSGIESFCNFFIDAINKLISGLNKVSFTIPDWDILGDWAGKKFGINIPSIDKVQIPKLAQGAVIQPNNEFLAMLGDQKSGVNIETPLSTMVSAFKQALSESGYSNDNSTLQITLMMDGRKLGELIYPHVNAAKRNKGGSFVTVEVDR